MIRICFTSLLFMFAQLSLANSFHDDSHYVPLGARTGYYVVRDGSRLSHQLGVDDSPYIDTSDPLRHGYGADVLAFRFNHAGQLIMAPSYIANAQLNEFYTSHWLAHPRLYDRSRCPSALRPRPSCLPPPRRRRLLLHARRVQSVRRSIGWPTLGSTCFAFRAAGAA